MAVCELVNGTMKPDAIYHLSGIQPARISFHRIGNEITKQYLVIVGGKVYVAKEIQTSKLSQKERELRVRSNDLALNSPGKKWNVCL